MRTCGDATRADTDPRGRLRGAKDTNNAYWAHKYSGPMIEDMGGVLGTVGDARALRALRFYTR